MIFVTGGGLDYDSGPYNVMFLAGEASATLDISIIDDTILENNENFTVMIDSTSLPINVVIANNSGHATVTIVDDDSE